MTLLDVQHVKKIYKTRFKGNQVEALKDIHFTVEKGEYVAIMGESGSGKSTRLNILAMLDKPTAGRVYLNGMDTATIKNKDASSFRREKLGFVFQDFNLLDTLSVKDNILLPLVLSRRPLKQMMTQVDAISRQLGIHSLLEKYPYEISGGQKQRRLPPVVRSVFCLSRMEFFIIKSSKEISLNIKCSRKFPIH